MRPSPRQGHPSRSPLSRERRKRAMVLRLAREDPRHRLAVRRRWTCSSASMYAPTRIRSSSFAKRTTEPAGCEGGAGYEKSKSPAVAGVWPSAAQLGEECRSARLVVRESAARRPACGLPGRRLEPLAVEVDREESDAIRSRRYARSPPAPSARAAGTKAPRLDAETMSALPPTAPRRRKRERLRPLPRLCMCAMLAHGKAAALDHALITACSTWAVRAFAAATVGRATGSTIGAPTAIRKWLRAPQAPRTRQTNGDERGAGHERKPCGAAVPPICRSGSTSPAGKCRAPHRPAAAVPPPIWRHGRRRRARPETRRANESPASIARVEELDFAMKWISRGVAMPRMNGSRSTRVSRRRSAARRPECGPLRRPRCGRAPQELAEPEPVRNSYAFNR